MNSQSITKPQPLNGEEVPRNDVVTYTVDDNKTCPRGIFPGQIVDAHLEPHETLPEAAFVVVQAKVNTGIGDFTVKGKLFMDKGVCTPLMMLRRNTGEKFSDLQEEHRASKDRKSTFELSKLTGRAVAVQIVDSSWKTPEGETKEFTRVGFVNPSLVKAVTANTSKTNESKNEKEVSKK
jgi:hypothetical protein